MRDIFSAFRSLLYGLLWMTAAVELGLTAARIAFTQSTFRFSGRIVVELLVASVLTLLWVPLAIVVALRSNRDRSHLWLEFIGLSILWVMFLVGGASTTNIWPQKFLCDYVGKQCGIITTLVVFAWISFGLLNIIGTIILMHGAAHSDIGGTGVTGAPTTTGYSSDKAGSNGVNGTHGTGHDLNTGVGPAGPEQYTGTTAGTTTV